MKRDMIDHPLTRPLLFLALAAGLALPLPALAGTVSLATSPLATSTTTVVKPNVMFMLDDSGSMDWDYMPDDAKNFAGQYGFNSAQCNGAYYNPAMPYSPPVDSTGAALNATPTSFSVAYDDGYNTGAGTSDLGSQFTGGSGSGASGINLAPGPAFYYTYSGTQTTNAQKDIHNTSSIFYKECNSNFGDTTKVDGINPVNTVFNLVRLALIPTTTLTVGSGVGGGATITVSASNSNTSVSGITVNGVQILSGTTSSSKIASTVANRIAANINACTAAATGNCGASGYAASVAGSVVTVTGPDSGHTPNISKTGNMSFTATAFPIITPTSVTSIKVNGLQILGSATLAATSTNSLANDIKSKISAIGYSATVSGSVVTVTGPASASTYTPVITTIPAGGSLTVTTVPFPESTPAKLQNFANWYSYYSHRMLMMKTAGGLAFQPVTDKYRVGFMTMNNNVSPGFVDNAPFNATQKALWYNKFYAAQAGNNTPLREALSHVGQYYAHKFGTINIYKSTITVGGSGASAVKSIQVNGVELMDDTSVVASTTSAVAKAISDQINAPQVTDFGASVSGNVITILGPASALSKTPVITKDSGNMTFSATAFALTTSTASLNGVTPLDPMEYSCQQNFVILSTDGYWNGSTTYDLNNNPVGQQDGTAARPMNDGFQSNTTVTITYTQNTYSSASCSPNVVGNKRLQTLPKTGSCNVTVSGTPTGSESCTPSSSVSGTATYGSCVSSASVGVPSPATTAWVEQGRVTTPAGGSGGTSDTLADVAMYYYATDLRDNNLGNCTGALGLSVCENNVFISGKDNNTQQHLTTFTLGLGARGRMVYSPSYQTDPIGDYVAVKLGSTASSTVCNWQTAGTVCTWPTPSSGAMENIDDLWHAAVNGRGAYFAASDPTTLKGGLTSALAGVFALKGAAAAAATSTLNPVAGNNMAYVASYTTVSWKGNLEARGINTDDGVVSNNATWCMEDVPADSCLAPSTVVAENTGDTTIFNCVTPNSSSCPGGTLGGTAGTDCQVPVAIACTGTLKSLVSSASDTRKIYTNNGSNVLTPFDAAYATANPTNFVTAKVSQLSQWSSLDATQQAAAVGTNFINYLRGQNGHELNRTGNATSDQWYRYREAVMGDALESQPAYIGAPVFSYPYPGYSTYLTNQASRAGTVFMGTNDGMLHAINANDGTGVINVNDGTERWAYVPTMVIPNMWRLADVNYATMHTNYVDGSPITSDICSANCTNAATAVWKTILVGGLNGGGRGYYALDITVPNTPVLLWEFTPTNDADLGYSFGKAIITRNANGTWVVLVTSGYDNGTLSGDGATNNSPTGSGLGYLYVLNAATGAIISKISTGVGTAANPSGLARISGWNNEPAGNATGFVYGGDLLGNLWRFDINSSAAATIGTGTVMDFATLYADGTTANVAGTSPQPITTAPVLGQINGKRVVFIGTGQYLGIADLTTVQTQTQYAIEDADATATLVNPRTTLVKQTLTKNPDGTATRVSASSACPGAACVDFSTGRGWYVDLPDGGISGVGAERANIEAKLVQGTLLVPTLVPSSSVCSPGGYGWLNYLDYRTGGAIALVPGNLQSSVRYDATIVGINVLFVQGDPIVEVVTSNNPTPQKDPDVVFKASAAGFTGKRVNWRELIP